MKHTRYFWLIAVVVSSVWFGGCKQEAASHPVAEEETPAPVTEKPAPPPVSVSQSDTTKKNPNLVANMSWTFLTDGILVNRATISSGKVGENPNKGHWIDFHDDGTFDSGVWGEKTAEGTWTYDDDTKLLEIIPTTQGHKHSEWRVMYKEDTIVLIGTATYGDNSNQEQWVRHDSRPDPNDKPRYEQDDDE